MSDASKSQGKADLGRSEGRENELIGHREVVEVVNDSIVGDLGSG
jgi:hypothetical protein